MFRFQGGPFVEVFTTQGTAPLKHVSSKGRVKKVFDKDVKSYALVCDGGPSSTVDLLPPSGSSSSSSSSTSRSGASKLGLTQRYLVFQLFLPPAAETFSVEILITDTAKTRRRVVLSHGFRSIVCNPLHAQLPLLSGFNPNQPFQGFRDGSDDYLVPRGQWCSICFDMNDIVQQCFKGSGYRSIDAISMTGHFKLRKVFTLKDAPADMLSGDEQAKAVPIQRSLQFPSSMEYQPLTVLYCMRDLEEWVKRHEVTTTKENKSGLKRLGKTTKPSATPDPRVETARSNSSISHASVDRKTPAVRRSNQHNQTPLESARSHFVQERGQAEELSSARSLVGKASPGVKTSARREELSSARSLVGEASPGVKTSARREASARREELSSARSLVGEASPRVKTPAKREERERPVSSKSRPSSRPSSSASRKLDNIERPNSTSSTKGSRQERPNSRQSARSSPQPKDKPLLPALMRLKQKQQYSPQREQQHEEEEEEDVELLSDEDASDEQDTLHQSMDRSFFETSNIDAQVENNNSFSSDEDKPNDEREETEDEEDGLGETQDYWNRLQHGRTLLSSQSADADTTIQEDENEESEDEGEYAVQRRTLLQAEEHNETINDDSDIEEEAERTILEEDNDGDALEGDDILSLGSRGGNNFHFEDGDELEESKLSMLSPQQRFPLEASLERERKSLLEMEQELENEERALLGDDEEEGEKYGLNQLTAEIVQSTISKAIDSRFGKSNQTPRKQRGEEDGEEEEEREDKPNDCSEELDLIFDPILDCYYCPKTEKYYQKK